jgi:hypothetical protein
MYCEDSEATDIEHFYPKSLFPLKAFEWINYLLACSNCNSNYKRALFPQAAGGEALLINPMDDDPLDHLLLSLSTGVFSFATDKGRKSIEIFGLNRPTLAEGRRGAWSIFSELSVAYAGIDRFADPDRTLRIIHALKTLSFSSVVFFAKKYFANGVLSEIAPMNVVESLNENPEILDIAN